MTDVAVIGFDYSAVPADKAASARAAAERIRGRMQLAAESIIEVGRELIEQKRQLGHGNFLPWIEAEFGMTDRTARRFMSVAEILGSKMDTVSDLTPKALYALAAPSTPDSVRDEVLDRAAAGEKVTAKEIEDLKKKLKAAQQKAADEADRAKANIARADRADEALDTAKYKVRHLETQVERLSLEVSKLQEDGVIHVIKSDPVMIPPLPPSYGLQEDAPGQEAILTPPKRTSPVESAARVAAASRAFRDLRGDQEISDFVNMNLDVIEAALVQIKGDQ